MKNFSRYFLAVSLLCTNAVFAAEQLQRLTLAQAVQLALHNQGALKVSQAALEEAEAQYQQAMGAFRPHVNLEAGFQRNDQDRTFTFAGVVQTPAMALPLGPGGALVPIPGQPLPINIDVKLFNRDITKATLGMEYPLYTGGKQQAIEHMASKGVEIAQVEQRKSELEVVHDINKYYYGAQYAQQMAQLSSDTVERFQVLQDLTERLYQNASLKVKKTDYLRIRTTTALARTMLQEARYAETLSKAALVNAMGLASTTELTLAEPAPVGQPDAAADELVALAMSANPDRQRLDMALQIADDKIDAAKSGYLPMVGFEASTYQYWNSYNGGLFNDANRKGWTIGVGAKWNLFEGGMTRAAVSAAHANKMKMEQQKLLLDRGLALQVQECLLRIQRSRAQSEAGEQAQHDAEENRQLLVRAFQQEMVESKDVIEAQMIEGFASASLYRSQHELRTALSDLNQLLGRLDAQGQP